MKAKGSFILIITALFILTGFLPFVPVASAEPPTRADLEGTLNTQTLTSAGSPYTFNDITVDARATITIEAGVTLLPDADSRFYINGKVLILGTSSNPVTIGSNSGNIWQGLRILGNAVVEADNLTIYKAVARGISVEGIGSKTTFTNLSIIGSAEGIYYSGARGGHVVDNCLISSISNYGMVIDSSFNFTISRLMLRYLAGTGIAITDSYMVHLKDINILSTGGYCFYTINSHNITLDDFTFDDGTTTLQTAGFYFLGSADDMTFSNGLIQGVNVAFLFATNTGRNINFTNVDTGPKVAEPIATFAVQTRGFPVFKDCYLKAAKNITRIDTDHPDFDVIFINTTWNRIRPFVVRQSAEIYLNWYLEGELVDGNGDRIPGQLVMNPGPIAPVGTYEMPWGYLPKIVIRDRVIQSRGELTQYNRFMFQSTDYPQNMYTLGPLNIDQYTFWTIMLDLDPIHDMPDSLDIDEDLWGEYNLYDYFDDPEGEDLDYEFETSENITLTQTGGPTSGEIRIKNKVKNWYGTGWAVITATDPSGNFTMANVTINILPVNDAPYFKTPLPAPVIDEDEWTWVNLTGKIADVENDPIEVSFPDGPNYDLQWDEDNLNLTITPVPNFNGLLEIKVNLSDGDKWFVDTLYVIVRSVNDPPVFTLRHPDGTEVGMGAYPQDEGPPLDVYLFEFDEDTSVAFTVDATDVDNTTLTYIIDPLHLEHGALLVEPLNPANFTYTPFLNDFSGDLVEIEVSDGEETISSWIWFKVTPVNDDPVFDSPIEWEIEVDIGTQKDIDISGMISDVDGDNLTITVDPDIYITVNGATLEILVTDSYKETSMEVIITLSDGTVDVTRTFTIHLVNWVETFFNTWKTDAKTDKWVVEVDAEEGLTLYLVVEDDEGNRTTYSMIYDEKKGYVAEIPGEAGMEGYSYWVSEEQDGDAISDEFETVLPALKEKDGAGFPWWIILLIVVIMIIAAIILYFVFARGGGYGGEVGDIGDEE